MHVRLSDEQAEFAEACRKLLERDCPTSLVRRLMEPSEAGHSDELFASLAGIGVFELAVPRPGDEGGFVELGLFYREAGRALVPTSLYSTVWAALLVQRAQPASPWLDRVRAGEVVATVAHVEEGWGRLDAERYATTATPTVDGGWALSGTKLFVQNGGRADLVLVVAQAADGSGIGVFAVERGAGVDIEEMATFGHDRQAVLSFDSVAAAPVAGPMPAHAWVPWFTAVNDRATALQCMEMLGGAERVLEDVVAYIKERIVFGRPVGSFQAAQHHVANLGIAVGAARVASYQALCRAAHADADARREVSIAKSWLSKAYKDVTILAHQLYGAIGYVRETDLHLWSQRAKTTEAFFGDRTYHLRRLADLTLGEVARVRG